MNRYIFNRNTSFKEIQIEIRVRYYLTPLRA